MKAAKTYDRLKIISAGIALKKRRTVFYFRYLPMPSFKITFNVSIDNVFHTMVNYITNI